jgi:hypothetical protein
VTYIGLNRIHGVPLRLTASSRTQWRTSEGKKCNPEIL